MMAIKHNMIPVIIKQDPKLFKGGCLSKIERPVGGGYMQGYMPRLFDQLVTMHKYFASSIFQHNLLCANVSKKKYALLWYICFVIISRDMIELLNFAWN